MKRVRLIFEYLLLRFLWGLFKLIGVNASSFIGGEIGIALGRFTSAHKTADFQLQKYLGVEDKLQREVLLNQMWENLGRTAAELPHLRKLINKDVFDKYVEVCGWENVLIAREQDKAIFFLSGHFANWEVAAVTAYVKGEPVVTAYRPANNPFVENLIQKYRAAWSPRMLHKGVKAARGLAAELARKGAAGILMDQKFNEGTPLEFLGHTAMTMTLPEELAMRYKTALLPARIERLEGFKFRITIFPALELSEDHHASIRQLHKYFEEWIREKPDQWFWVHRRWPKT
jgi:Kdo2-lipid IVA lauroyltransferase/acyltransferase